MARFQAGIRLGVIFDSNPLVFREGKGKLEIQSPRQVGTQHSALQGTFQIPGLSSTSLLGAPVVARARVALVLYPGGH